MTLQPTIWHGYRVCGDSEELDAMIKHSGFINLDKDDIEHTLSKTGDNYVATAQASTMAEALREALNKLPVPAEEMKRTLMEFQFSLDNPVPVTMIEDIQPILKEFGPDVELKWGISNNEMLGNEIKIVLLASCGM